MLQSVNGCKIHYEIKQNNQSAESPVLFLHGWGCDADIFTALIAAAGERATTIALDFPAHGRSEAPPAVWGVRDFADQVYALLQEIGVETVDVVAHSFGVRVAIYLASQHPEVIGKLVFTGGAGIRKPASPDTGKRTVRYKRLSRIVRTLRKLPLLDAPMRSVQDALVRKYGSPDYAKLSESMRATFVKIILEDLTPLLPGIIAPTLLIWGAADTETPLWMGETMEREIKDAGLVVFDGRSHYAFLEESERFLTIVKQFFWGGHEV